MRGRKEDDRERKGRREREKKERKRESVGRGAKWDVLYMSCGRTRHSIRPRQSLFRGREGPIAVRSTDINQIESLIEY